MATIFQATRLLIFLSLFAMILICIKFTSRSYSINLGRSLLGLLLPATLTYEEPSTHTKDLYKTGYTIANSDACDDTHENVLVTILVISAPDHFKHREAIRQTWGNTSQRKTVVFSFLVGLSDNSIVAKAVIEESEMNGDVIVNNITLSEPVSQNYFCIRLVETVLSQVTVSSKS